MNQADREKIFDVLMANVKPDNSTAFRSLVKMTTEEINTIEPIIDGIVKHEIGTAILVLNNWRRGAGTMVTKLSSHWVMEMRCDEEAKTDQVFCACGAICEKKPSVAEAARSWAKHVLEAMMAP